MLRRFLMISLAALSWAVAFHLGSSHAQAVIARQPVAGMSISGGSIIVMTNRGDLYTLDLREVKSGKVPVRIGSFWGAK